MFLKIDFNKRFEGSDRNTFMFTSLDGTDYRIQEPTEFDRKWYSHKFKGPGLRYEIGLNISTGDIIWTNGPYPCGSWTDIMIARDSYVHCILPGELTLADDGYPDRNYFVYPRIYPEVSFHQKKIMQRHETVNHRFKQFGILQQTFRHDLIEHVKCFNAIANIIQTVFNNGDKLYQV